MAVMGVNLRRNMERVQRTIAAACRRTGRHPQDVTVLAVTKSMPDAIIPRILELGIKDLGENRMPQAQQRALQFPQAHWHFIGTLQTRKVKHCQPFSMIHSLDRWKLALALNKQGETLQRQIPVLLQVNIAGEASKHGVEPEQAVSICRSVVNDCRYLNLRGMMTMAPIGPPKEIRPVFRALRLLNQEATNICGLPMDILSMGMSGDYEIAVEEGATIVRLGSTLMEEEM